MLVLLLLAISIPLFADSAASHALTAQMIVTVSYLDDRDTPVPTAADVIVTQQSQSLSVTRLEALRDDTTPLELMLVIDNCSDFDPGSAGDELRQFLRSQPPNTSIGSAYIQGGHLANLREPSRDRETLIKSLIPPVGCQPASPFLALRELITRWRPGALRRVVIMISDGVDPDIKPGYRSDSAETALQAAQRAGVILYALYHPGRQYQTNTSGAVHSGQVLLAHVACETGGQAYFSGFGPLPSLAPFIYDIDAHLRNQYALEFVIRANDSHSLQPVTVRSRNQRFNLAAPWAVPDPKTKPQVSPSSQTTAPSVTQSASVTAR